MTVEKYLIAGLRVSITVRGELLRKRCEKYRCDFEGEPDIVINIGDEAYRKAVERYAPLSADEAEYLDTGCIFYFYLLDFDGFMLHSSCISYNGKAYLFSADSGTGKSTHTGLWKKYIDGVEYVNDDKPAIRLIDGKFHAIGTPWSGKTDQNCDVSLPLGGVVLLGRGKENVIYRANAVEAVTAIFRQTIMPIVPESTETLTELIDKLLTTVPTYHFECNISEDAVKTSFEALTGEKYTKKDTK